MSEEEKIQRDLSAPDQPQTDDEWVHLPAAIADEIGISRSQARMMIATGTVEIDGEHWSGGMDVPHEKISGKTVRVTGDGVLGTQFQYVGPKRDRFTGDRFEQS